MDTIDVIGLREFSDEEFNKSNLFQSGRMFSDVYCFEPGQEQTPHVHDDADKIYYVLEGQGTFVVGNDKRTIERGKALIAPAGEQHGVRNTSDERLRIFVFMAKDHIPDDGTGEHIHSHEATTDHDNTHGNAYDHEHSNEIPHDHSGEGEHSDVAIVTVSTSRSKSDGVSGDPSGDAIEELTMEADHSVAARTVVPDDTAEITAAVEAAINDGVDVVFTTGGTGLTPDDVTVEGVRPLFDRVIPGFGEEFRQRSKREIGLAGLLSRSTAGVVEETLVFVLPGSENAVRLGVGELVLPQLDHFLHQVRR